MPRSKTPMIAYAAKGMEQKKHSSTVSGTANLYRHFGTQYCSFSKNWKLSYIKHITKGHFILSQGYALSFVHSSYIYRSQKVKQPRFPSTEEWIKNMWHICTMEYHSAVKSKDILIFSSK